MLDTPDSHIQDTTLIDYIRLATFSPVAYSRISRDLEEKHHEWKPKKWMQYRGRKAANNVFHGSGNQKGRTHYIIECSGYGAHAFAEWISGHVEATRLAVYCTRIDLQRTQLQPAMEHRPQAFKRLTGPKRLEQSDTGMTLYVGARTSDTYVRIYDKTADLLRLEIELKGKRAKKAWLALLDGESLSSIYNLVLKRTRVANFYVKYFWANAKQLDRLPDVEVETTMESKLEWMATLDGLAFKLANDHDLGERAHALFARWTEYAQNLDKT